MTAAGLDTFSYNNAGQMIGRSIAGVSSTLAYDETGWLETVTTGSATSTYKYDAGGNRIIRSEGATTTLFLDGIEATSTLGGQPVVSKYYAIGTTTVAVRVGGVLSWIANDVQGTPAAAVQAGSSVFSRQLYFPFGEVRGPSNQIPGSRGYIGQVEDDATQLVYLNARFYDPVLHRFLTPDPVSVGEEPQSLNPYTYAGNNPINATDPSGLWGWPKIKLPKIKVPKFLHTALDVAGMVPGIGEIADAANAALYVAEGDYTNAAISMAGMIPFGGAAATGGRLIAKGGREVAGAVTRRGARAGGEAIAEKTAKEAAGKSITEGTQRGTTEAAARSRKTGADSASCRANSFIPGTEVVMGDGSRAAIEDIELGDLVLVTDPVTGEQGPRTVVDVIVGSGVKLLVDITVEARGPPTTLTATEGHPFWVVGRGWVDAGDLVAGDRLIAADGATHTVTAVAARVVANQTVHNLTVEGIHTYHVATGTTDTLVHNCAMKNSDYETSRGQKGNLQDSPTGKGSVAKGDRAKDRTASKSLKDRLFKKQDGRCANCDRRTPRDEMDGHHYPLRWADGGRMFRLVCRACHKYLHRSSRARWFVGDGSGGVAQKYRVEHQRVRVSRHWRASRHYSTVRLYRRTLAIRSSRVGRCRGLRCVHGWVGRDVSCSRRIDAERRKGGDRRVLGSEGSSVVGAPVDAWGVRRA